MNIVEWLEKQIEHDELLAREGSRDPVDNVPVAADGAHWTWVEDVDWEPTEPDVTDPDWTATALCSVERRPSRPVLTRRGVVEDLCALFMYADGPAVGAAAHIVNWDPARVLLECRAKRLILAECVLELKDREGGLEGKVGTTAWYVLTGMALGYADRPGYEEHWPHG